MFEQSFTISVIKLLLVNMRKNIVATLRLSRFFYKPCGGWTFGYAEFCSFISMTEFFLWRYPDLGHFMPMVFSSLLFHMISALSQPHSGQWMASPILCFILVFILG
jgi:hypothetical protein